MTAGVALLGGGAGGSLQGFGGWLTYDHRVRDGEAAGRFMAAFKRVLEQPLELLLRLK